MKKILFCFFILLAVLGNAQNPGDVAQTFGSSGGFDKSAQCTITQPDGKILVGGSFSSYNSLAVNGLCRLNTDGSVDNSFNVGVGFSTNAIVNSLALQNDGKIIVGGVFTNYNGTVANNIIRLNADGSIDSSFNYGTGFNGGVNTIKIQSDGKILVGGQFTNYQGVSQKYLIRLNTDGTKDSVFDIGTGFDRFINTIAIQTDGKIIAGGNFTTFNGANSPKCIIRLNSNGSIDSTFITSGGFNQVVLSSWYTGTVNVIELQSDGKIVVGGIFDVYTANTTSQSGKRIIRLNSDGTKDTSFNVNNGFLFNSTTPGTVNTIKILSDGKIMVGGDFNSYYTDLTLAKKIIRLNTDGTKDTSFNFGNGFDGIVYNINVLSSTDIIVVGDFSSYGFGDRARKIARLNSTGSFDTSFYKGNGLNGYVNSIAIQQDNKIIAGGSFNAFQNTNQNNIIRFNNDGSKDTSFNVGTGFNGAIYSVILQTNGKIIVGGSFGSYNGSVCNRIARLNSDGTLDTSFNIGTGFNNSFVHKLILQPDGKIIVLGDFTSYNGVSTKHIIRLNTDGTKDSSFNAGATGFNFFTNLVAVLQTDGKIIVGGNFTQFNGNTENYIVRLNADGTKDTTFITGTGFNSAVNALIVRTNGKIIIGGSFTTYNGATGKNYILGLNADGSIDNSFNIGTGLNLDTISICLQGDDKVIVGGWFSTYNGTTTKQIVRLNTDGSIDSSFSTGVGFSNEGGFSPSVNNLNISPNGKIIAVGNFNIYQNSNYSTSIIALHGGVALSTNDFELNNSISVFPNPVKDILNVSSTDNATVTSLKIYDLQGKLIAETTNNYMNTSNLSAGLYVVKIVTDQGQLTKKFIKE